MEKFLQLQAGTGLEKSCCDWCYGSVIMLSLGTLEKQGTKPIKRDCGDPWTIDLQELRSLLRKGGLLSEL